MPNTPRAALGGLRKNVWQLCPLTLEPDPGAGNRFKRRRGTPPVKLSGAALTGLFIVLIITAGGTYASIFVTSLPRTVTDTQISTSLGTKTLTKAAITVTTQQPTTITATSVSTATIYVIIRSTMFSAGTLTETDTLTSTKTFVSPTTFIAINSVTRTITTNGTRTVVSTLVLVSNSTETRSFTVVTTSATTFNSTTTTTTTVAG